MTKNQNKTSKKVKAKKVMAAWERMIENGKSQLIQFYLSEGTNHSIMTPMKYSNIELDNISILNHYIDEAYLNGTLSGKEYVELKKDYQINVTKQIRKTKGCKSLRNSKKTKASRG